MSRHPSLPPRHRAVVVGVAGLAVLLVAALLVPRGGSPEDGALTPSTRTEYVARDSAPGPGSISTADRAEIDRVLAQAPTTLTARQAPTDLAEQLVRCAEFEEQRYCLGVGWTTQEPEAARDLAVATPQTGRTVPAETTGDLTTPDLLAQRAAMSPAELEATERAELEEAARSVAKVVLLRHQLLGEPLPDGFLARHPEARATTDETVSTTTSARTTSSKGFKDYPRRDTVLNNKQVRAQRTTYWCGPASMQMIAWGWQDRRKTQKHWADRLGTTTSGSAISEMVRVVNGSTGYDREKRAGRYIVLDISGWSFKKWMLLQLRHIHDYRAPVVLHPILLERFYPYLDDDASGHFQVGRGYDKNGDKPGMLGYFEPWNQQRFDPSEPYIARVQWRRAYNSFRANKAHPHQNIGV
jgi:hypothetical protein